MELLLRTNFDMPKPPGGVFDPLRYLSLGAVQQDAIKEQSEVTTAASVYEVARPILQGCHAIPTKLKILLDRVLSSLKQEEVLTIISGCGWQLDDYQRGYKLKDANGSPLDRWNMCTKLEEPLILQQFLRFKETRNISQQLILQDLTERSFHPLLDKSKLEAADQLLKQKQQEEKTAAALAASQRSPDVKREPHISAQGSDDGRKEDSGKPYLSPKREATPPAPSAAPGSRTSPVSSSAAPSITPIQPPASPIFPRISNGIPLPPSSVSMSSIMPNHFPMFPFPGIPTSLPQQLSKDSSREANCNGGALNLTRPSKEDREPQHQEMDSEAGSRRSSIEAESLNKRQFTDDLGTSFVSPTTGKKRVQCNVCMKTFCDKGALKIHFSAVHLREMHKCTVAGCNMMFSSRRSRNRHSANPNPKLHTPQVKRRISQNDGRTHPGPPLSLLSKESGVPVVPKDGTGFPIPPFPALSPAAAAKPAPAPGMPPFPFPGLPGFNPFLPSDLKSLQQYQKDFQRLTDLQKLCTEAAEDSRQAKDADSDTESQKKEDLSADPGGNRKRKSQNPTKRPHLDVEENDHVSSDSASDEGFPDPMMDMDDDDELDNVSSGDDAA